MAWTTKPSATTAIPKRAAPYLAPETTARWERDLLPRYATRQGALMPILHEIQHEHRCIPWQAMVEIAAFLRITPAEVLDTVTFYDEFTTEQRGKCIIGICQSIACEACGHRALLDHAASRLGIEPGETTPDGSVTLLAMECLGGCDGAPVALVGPKLHERLDRAALDRIIDAAQSGKGGH